MSNPFANLTEVTAAEYQKHQAAGFTEDAFQAVVIAEAKRQGYLVHHTHDSRRSEAGYPDLHLVNQRLGRSIFRELKTMTGKVRPKQAEWLEQLRAVGQDADVWRPIQWVDGTISEYLAAGHLNVGRSGRSMGDVEVLRQGLTPAYSTTADAQNVIRHLTEQLDMKLQPWQKAALAAAMVTGRVTVTRDTKRADLKHALNRIHPNH